MGKPTDADVEPEEPDTYTDEQSVPYEWQDVEEDGA